EDVEPKGPLRVVRAPQAGGDATRVGQGGGVDRFQGVLTAERVTEVMVVQRRRVSVRDTAQLITGCLRGRGRPDGLQQLQGGRYNRGALRRCTPRPPARSGGVSRSETDAQADQFA